MYLWVVPEDLDESIVENGLSALVGDVGLSRVGKRYKRGLGIAFETHLHSKSEIKFTISFTVFLIWELWRSYLYVNDFSEFAEVVVEVCDVI